jgi:hypothetical protein
VASQGIDYMDAAAIGMHLRAGGLDDTTAKAEVLNAAWVVRRDSLQVILNQLRIPLLSIGMKYPVFIGNADTVVHRGFTNRGYAHHVAYWGKWEGGTLRDNYAEELDTIVRFSRASGGLYDSVVIEELERSLRPFLADHPVRVRDPLCLLEVPSDVWLLGWFSALCILWTRNRMVVAILVAPVLATYIMSVIIPIGNPRYAYPLIPMYTIGLVIGLEYIVACVSRRRSGLLQPVG